MVSFLYLVDKQVKNYLLRRKLNRKSNEEVFQPCITFSRENGSGGHLVAEKTAQKLGFKFYDEELIDLIAKKSHLKRRLIKSVDEKSQDTIESIINTFLGFEPLPKQEYIRGLIRVVLAIAYKGEAVILGRGSNFIVPSRYTLSVRVIAPIKVRLANSAKYEYPGRSLNFIKEKMLKIHLERKNFIQKYFGKNISNANYYDLVLNTENLSVKQATNIVIAAFKEKFSL